MTEGALDGASVRTGVRPARPMGARVRLSPRLWWQASQALADFVTISLAAALTYLLYLESGIGRAHFNPALYLQLDLLGSALTVFALHGTGEYSRERGLLRIESIRRIIVAVGTGMALTLVVSFLVRLTSYSRVTMLAVLPAVILALTAQRFFWWWMQDRYMSTRRRPVLVYGAGETGRVLAQHLLDEHHLGLVPVAFLDDKPELRGVEVKVGAGTDGERLPVLGGESDLDGAVRSLHPEAVFLAMPSAPSSRIAHLVAQLEARGMEFYCVPSAGDLLFASLTFGQIAGMPVFSRRAAESSAVYDFVKRAVDLVAASTLLVFTSPLLLLGSLLVKLTSPGPVLFRQTRIGLNGRQFTIFKLRTMRTDAPKYAPHPTDSGDPRITTVGKWLRKSSIDELPQLFNVVRGEMSLVGPRPEMPFVVGEYNGIQKLRLLVKPGVTGLWQISADRAFRIHDNIRYDLYYVERRSLILDAAIMLVTPFVLFARDHTA